MNTTTATISREDDQEAPGPAQDLGDPAFVAVRRRLEAAVEPAEEAALVVLVAGLDRLQEAWRTAPA